jgi:hypothetical protein
MPVARIDTDLVLRCLEPIWTKMPETASRVRQRIERVLDWAKVRGYPCRHGRRQPAFVALAAGSLLGEQGRAPQASRRRPRVCGEAFQAPASPRSRPGRARPDYEQEAVR